MKTKHAISDTEEEEGETNQEITAHNEVLDEVVEDVSEYQAVTNPGALPQYQLTDPDLDVYLVTIPNDLLDPLKLIGEEMVFGGGKERELVLDERRYCVASYPASSTSRPPSLFVPDMKGVLHKVADAKIKGHVALRGGPHADPEEDEEGIERVDLDSLRSDARHLPPTDLKPRNFFTSFMSEKSLNAGQGKATKKRKNKSLMEEQDGEEGLRTEKKKVTQCRILCKAGVISQEGGGGGKKRKRTVTEPEITEDFIRVTEGQKKSKKLKREEAVVVKLEKERREEEVAQDTFGLTEGRKKDKKNIKQKNIGGEVLMKAIKIEAASEEEEERIYPSQDLFAESSKKNRKSKMK